MSTNKTTKQIKCSFCGRESNEVSSLIAGPDVYICDICVKASVDIIKNNMDNLVQEITNWSIVENSKNIYVISDIPFAEELAKNLKININVEDM